MDDSCSILSPIPYQPITFFLKDKIKSSLGLCCTMAMCLWTSYLTPLSLNCLISLLWVKETRQTSGK